mmetsp:Transcript_4003/g.11401  ORF Transcript_4003/g.11401 Transcript_4003/m.11401 type:complete len:218 (-) Transcript_4003:892-1545(-)
MPDRFVDKRNPKKCRRVAEGGMTTIQDTDLHELPFRDVVNERHVVEQLQLGPAEGEVVFQHPLPVRLAEHRGGVLESQLGLDVQPLLVRRGGRDPIDHAVGTGHVGRHPGGEVGIDLGGEAEQHAPNDPAVVGDVVATEDGEGTDSGLAAHPEGLEDHPERRLGSVGVDDVVLNLWMVGIELSIVEKVTALRDGEGDYLNVGAGHALEEAGTIGVDG